MSRVFEVKPRPTLRLDPLHPPSLAEVRYALQTWSANPVRLPRPVILHPGFMMPAFMLNSFMLTLKACATHTEGRILRTACHPLVNIRELGRRLALRAEALYEEDGHVDVVGHSMGGIVTREAARHRYGPRLRVARLFCLSSPHRGAGFLAPYTPHHHARALRVRSPYLAELNADPTSQDFEIHTFRLQKDLLISQESAHAVGDSHYDWPAALHWLPTHAQAQWDVRMRIAVVGMLLGHVRVGAQETVTADRQVDRPYLRALERRA